MKTPAGVECKYFYGDYYRGRRHEECRLLGDNPTPQTWTPDLCRTCPVPGIIRANACPYMVLEARVDGGLLGLRRRVKITAYCNLSQTIVNEPQIGCGRCHPLSDILAGNADEPDPSSRPG